jgi:hypothetical protein
VEAPQNSEKQAVVRDVLMSGIAIRANSTRPGSNLIKATQQMWEHERISLQLSEIQNGRRHFSATPARCITPPLLPTD